MKSNKYHGDNGIASLMLRQLANELKGLLTIIYNRSTSESKIQHIWKIANATLIFLNDKKCEADNNRPRKVNITRV